MWVDNDIEEEVALDSPQGFEILTSGTSVTGTHLYADGGDGHEKQATVLDSVAGASSAAPAASGIPSAMRQQAIENGVPSDNAPHRDETAMADRTIPMREDVKP